VTRELRLISIVVVAALVGALLVYFGWHLPGIALLILSLAALAGYFLLVVRVARIPRDSLLHIRLAGSLREHAASSLLDRVRGRGFTTLHQLREALTEAARDPALSAVMVEISGLECGLATAQELHDLIARIKATGKRTVAVFDGDTVSAREYLIGCAAGELIANPDVTLAMVGIGAGGPFVKRALDKLQVQAQALQWKEYKGAAEMFSREQMSEPLRHSIAAVLDDCDRVMMEYVARARALPLDTVKEMLNLGFVAAGTARERKLLDGTGYAHDLLVEFDRDDDKRVVGMARYLRRVHYRHDRGRRPRIALVYGVGPVISGEPPLGGEFMSAPETAADLNRAARDPQVKAVVFRVNSPGGSAVGSDLIWRAVSEARRRGKPVVVSMGDVAGSGGYYVAMGADAIVAQPATITGSIGVVYVKFSARELMARLGIDIDRVQTNPMADALSITRPLAPAELEQLDRTMGELYGNFTAKVAEGRQLDATQTEAVARGRVWSGRAALAHGLVDALGGLEQAIAIAREKVGLKSEQEHELAVVSGARGLAGLKATFWPADTHLPWLSALAGLCGVREQWLPAILTILARSQTLFLCPWM